MSQKDFFEKIKDELHGHPFRDRFLEELKEHAEDMEDEKLDQSQWKKRMGSPQETKDIFLNIMHPFRKLFFTLEGLFYGFLLIPVTLVYFTYIRWMFTEAPITMMRMFFGISVVILLIVGIFTYALRKFNELKSNVSHPKIQWLSLTVTPSLFILSILTFSKHNETYYFMPFSEKIFSLFTYLVIISLSFFLAHQFNQTTSPKRRFIRKKNFLTILKSAAIIYISLAIILKTLFTYFEPNTNNELLALISKILSIFSPVIWMEYLFVFFWSNIANSIFSRPNLFAGFYSLIIFFLFLAAQSLWVIIKEKKYVSLRALVILYVMSLFLIHPNHFYSEPNFMVPAWNISKKIEKNQLGLFYPILKYFNRDEGTFFKYTVDQNNEGFVIQSNTENYTYIPLNSLEAGKPQLDFDPHIHSMGYVNLPDYYECDRKDVENCNMNDFVSRFVTKNGGLVTDAAFSEDGKWAVISMMSAVYDPENVYLVQLAK